MHTNILTLSFTSDTRAASDVLFSRSAEATHSAVVFTSSSFLRSSAEEVSFCSSSPSPAQLAKSSMKLVLCFFSVCSYHEQGGRVSIFLLRFLCSPTGNYSPSQFPLLFPQVRDFSRQLSHSFLSKTRLQSHFLLVQRPQVET